MAKPTKSRDWLRLPVVSASSEYLVMGYLMRRNILAYKAPQNNEGYDLICIHPDPRHRPAEGQKAQVRVQVKSRYATDCDRGFPVKEVSFEAFDFLIVAFLNIGKFYGRTMGQTDTLNPTSTRYPMTSFGSTTTRRAVGRRFASRTSTRRSRHSRMRRDSNRSQTFSAFHAHAKFEKPNQAMELTAGRCDIHFSMTSTFQPAAKLALASGSSSCSR